MTETLIFQKKVDGEKAAVRISLLRRQRNSDLVRRMRRGDPLKPMDLDLSRFPPRQMIKKDLDVIQRLYSGLNTQPTDS